MHDIFKSQFHPFVYILCIFWSRCVKVSICNSYQRSSCFRAFFFFFFMNLSFKNTRGKLCRHQNDGFLRATLRILNNVSSKEKKNFPIFFFVLIIPDIRLFTIKRFWLVWKCLGCIIMINIFPGFEAEWVFDSVWNLYL